jgi:hypothetical protein
MRVVSAGEKVNNLEQEIKRKEVLASDAREKGMYTTFSNYKADIAWLKTKLKKLQTDPRRAV